MTQPKCGKCQSTNIRIYREYGMFRRPETDRCNGCIDQSHKSWMVPCILNKDGDAWGYGSVPNDALNDFYELPEKLDTLPGWTRNGWSDSKV